MDSINKNQSELNHENLIADKAIEKIQELANKAKSCFFCTEVSKGPSEGCRPMSVEKVDANGHLWFLSAADSHKNEEIEANPNVKLYLQGSTHSDFLYLIGKARITKDKNKIEELWDSTHKTWFTEGKNDPRVSVIEVIPEEGYYWDTKHGNFVAGIKIMIGAALGKTLDDSIEGKIMV
jgi:general stress protein 26